MMFCRYIISKNARFYLAEAAWNQTNLDPQADFQSES
jgi:hypothetical protein